VNFVEAVIAWVHAHPHYAFAAVFLLACFESFPVLGGFVPGASAIIAIAAIMPKDAANLIPVLLAAIAGASLGDGLSFAVGHRYHRAVLGRWPLKNYPAIVQRAEGFIVLHGVKSIVLARLTPPVRAIVPLAAGILEMPVRRYAAANIAAAAIWATLHVGFGAFVGHSATFIEGKFGRYALIAAAVLAAAIFVAWRARRLMQPVGK
jgi:undecaprenyl-diphosphatase